MSWLDGDARIFVTGHRGMVGAAICRQLEERAACAILTADRRTLDLRDAAAVNRFLADVRPTAVVVAAATVGGIHANDSRPAEFIHDNLAIAANLIHGAWLVGIRRLLFLGSSCIYPRLASQPMDEGALLTGPLEPTNEPYAIAKIAGIKLCESYRRQYGVDYRSLMPTNLYGPGDQFDLEQAHVIPALIHRLHLAKASRQASVTVWGSGRPRREFLHVDDLAAACVHTMRIDEARWWRDLPVRCSHVNVGTGEDLPIAELAERIRAVVGFAGELRQDASKPDGAPRKLLDIARMRALGWEARIPLDEGLAQTYRWFLDHRSSARGTGTGR